MLKVLPLLMAAGLFLTGPALADVRLTFVGFAPPKAGSEMIPNLWMDEIEARTDKEVRFRRFPANQLCKGPEIIECVRDGRADVGAMPQSYTPSLFPISMIDGLPYVSSDQQAISKGLGEMYANIPAFREEHEKLGLHLQLYWSADPMLLATTFEPKSLDDFAGKRIRGVGVGPAAFVAALGAQPVALASGEQYEALRSGVLDGYTNSFEGSVAAKLQEVTTHWVDPRVGIYATVGLWISDKAWRKLSPEQQQVVNDVTRELIDGKAQTIYERSVSGFCTEVEASRSMVSFTQWPDALVEEMKTRVGSSAYDHWAAGVIRAGTGQPAELYATYLAYVQSFERHHPSVAQDCMANFRKKRS